MMKPHWAPMLVEVPGGYLARRIVATMKVRQLVRLPMMRGRRRPK